MRWSSMAVECGDLVCRVEPCVPTVRAIGKELTGEVVVWSGTIC